MKKIISRLITITFIISFIFIGCEKIAPIPIIVNEDSTENNSDPAKSDTTGGVISLPDTTIVIADIPEESDDPISFNEPTELLFIIWKLAKAEEYNKCKVQSINESIDNWFSSYINHPAVLCASKLKYNGTGYDAIGALGIRLLIDDNDNVVFNDKYSKVFDKRWSIASIDYFIPLVNDFYHDTKFHEWYMSWEALRNSAINSFSSINNIDYNWFDSFFYDGNERYVKTILSFIVGSHNYGLSIEDGESILLSPIIGCAQENGDGNVTYYNNYSTIVHELCHPYCNPIVEKYWDEISKHSTEIFYSVRGKMMSQDYGLPITMISETIVRASTIMYVLSHDISFDKNTLINNEEAKGFVLVRDVIDILEIRDKDYDKYPTIESIYSKIIDAINSFSYKSYPGSHPKYTYESTNDILPGVFSISETKKVRFTKGNLYWDGNGWALEDNQMNYAAEWDPYHIGHFFWAVNKEKAIATTFNMDDTYKSDHLFCDGSDEDHYLTVNGNDHLRALGADGQYGEMVYLINKRPNWKNLMKCPVNIEGVGNCLVIAPDDYTGKISESYDSVSWEKVEKEGLVCFAPTGNRYETNISKTSTGQYWCSTLRYEDCSRAYAMYIENNALYLYPAYASRNYGQAIRLVKDIEN